MNNFPRETKDQYEIKAFYGEPGEVELTRLNLPYPMVLSWDKSRTIKSFYCHEKVRDSLYEILAATLAIYGYDRIKELGLNVWGGCYNPRPKRGTKDIPSMHSYGIALDIDPNNNQLHWGSDVARLAMPEYEMFWKMVEANGWKSLGRVKNYDWMHIQATS